MSKWSSAFRDSRWQKLRLQVMERDGWKCKACGRGENDRYHVKRYTMHITRQEQAPWEYPNRFAWLRIAKEVPQRAAMQ